MAKNKNPYSATEPLTTPYAPVLQVEPAEETPVIPIPSEEEPRLPSEEELNDPNSLINILPEESLKERFRRYVTESHATMSQETDDEVVYWGLIGETGEVAELFKKARGHGHALELDVLRKEVGDVCWYVARVQERYGTKGEHGIEPYLIIGPQEEMLKRLAQQVAGCTTEFMREANAMDVTERCSRIVSYLAGVLREAELVYHNNSIADFHAHMEQSIVSVLDINKAKLESRYSQTGKFSTEESLNRKENDK